MKDAATTVRYTAFPHSTRSQAIVLLRAMSAFGGKADIGSARKTTLLTHFDISSDHLLWRTITDKHSLGRLVDTGRRTVIPDHQKVSVGRVSIGRCCIH